MKHWIPFLLGSLLVFCARSLAIVYATTHDVEKFDASEIGYMIAGALTIGAAMAIVSTSAFFAAARMLRRARPLRWLSFAASMGCAAATALAFYVESSVLPVRLPAQVAMVVTALTVVVVAVIAHVFAAPARNG